ncbi:hypothetical protein GCM10007147_07840 [Nocardiopsis kunsanensis]|uniref:DUF3068 domain-containing protein n=1 Tax=Nocardiopsis kunsanensis TaxID=141693 RepID=A0A918X944_9ACTN|nr:DUF3068 domain-containing protein [Nocardiopsis kunsanensis]GHD18164.1 hypothetical protein GCM10007147_07840 [Nocardiopsis kunsanensis]
MSTVSQFGAAPRDRGPVDSQVGPERRPRRSVPAGTLLIAAGTFLLTLAAMLPLYVHDRVALLPAVAEHEMRLVDGDAAYLNAANWSWVDNTGIERNISVDATANGDEWSAWQMTVDTSASDRIIDHWSRRVIVDRSTARAVNCCGEHVDGDRAVRQAGLVHHFPAGTDADSYPFYDAEVRSAPSMEFQGENDIAGVTARRYSQAIEATQVPGSARDVPADLFTPEARGTVTATRWLELTRTLWVEPVSGTVVNMQETRRETLRTRDSDGAVPLLEADLTMADTQVDGYAEQARVRSVLLRSLDVWAPWTLAPLGVLALAGGLLRARNHRVREQREGRPEQDGHEEPAEDGSGPTTP